MRALWLLFLVPALSGCIGFWTGAEDVPAPAFTVVDVDGAAHNLTEPGQILLLDFFGTWCGPCQRSVPDLRAMQSDYNLSILSISSTDTEAQVRDFQGQYQVTWPMAVDRSGVIQAYREAAGHSRVVWPSYAVVSDGRLTFFNSGETLPSTLATAVVAAGAKEPGMSPAVLLPMSYALGLGVATVASPFVWLQTRRQEIPASALAFATIGFGGLALMAAYAGAPLTGRVVNVSGLAAIVAVAALALAKVKGLEKMQSTSRHLEDERSWRRGLAWFGQWVYVGLPLWSGALLVAMRQTVAGAVVPIMVAYLAGTLLAAGAARRERLPSWSPWVGVAGIGLAALVAGAQWLR